MDISEHDQDQNYVFETMNLSESNMYDFISNFEEPKRKEGTKYSSTSLELFIKVKPTITDNWGPGNDKCQNILEDFMRIYSFLLY